MIKFLVLIVFVQAEMQTRGVQELSVGLIPLGEQAQAQRASIRIEILMLSNQEVEKLFHTLFKQRP